MQNQNSHQHQEPQDLHSKPIGFYFLMVLLAGGTTFIGWNFGGVIGAVLGFFFSCVVNIYALQIKND